MFSLIIFGQSLDSFVYLLFCGIGEVQAHRVLSFAVAVEG